MKNLTLYVGTVLSMTLLSTAAHAAVEVPEPSALSIIGGVAIAAMIANRFIRRK